MGHPGVVVQWQNISFACLESGFDSRQLHQKFLHTPTRHHRPVRKPPLNLSLYPHHTTHTTDQLYNENTTFKLSLYIRNENLSPINHYLQIGQGPDRTTSTSSGAKFLGTRQFRGQFCITYLGSIFIVHSINYIHIQKLYSEG